MKIERLTEKHLEEAGKLTLENYYEERLLVPGETFITCCNEMVNIQGTYCMPEYRGRHVCDDLLDFVIETMVKEGYTLLGVDCESYNPNALHFWNKSVIKQ